MGGVLAGLVPFVCVLWDFGLRPFRSATAQGIGSNFYDIQAWALMHGDLSVPTGSLGIEGFDVDGRTYMYFPPFPSLLRIPVLLITDRFDGRLTAPSMLLAWFVLAGATAALVWNVRIVIRGFTPVTRCESALYAVVVAAVAGGSVVVFLASLPWVYHEVYLWAGAFTVAALLGFTLLARHPKWSTAALTAGCALGAILTRTTSGWAMSITLIVTGMVILVRRQARQRVGVIAVVGGLTALFVGIAVNWAKFRHPYMFPLQDQVWTTVNSQRRAALAENGGSLTGTPFFWSSLANYGRPDGIRLVSYFPYVSLPAEPARSYGGAFHDQLYRTGAIPPFMPLLFVLTVWGSFTTFRRRPRSERTRFDHNLSDGRVGRAALRVPLTGALAITGGIMFYGYIAYRYTAEMLPVLVLGSAIGAVDIAGRLHQRSGRTKRAVAAGMVVGAAFGAVANAAAGLATARITSRGDRLQEYVEWQRHLGNVDGLVEQSPTLPEDGPADELRVVGNCDALYIGTGDQYEPWVTVEVREYQVLVAAGPSGFFASKLPLFTIDGVASRTVGLESDFDGRVRLVVAEGLAGYPTGWMALAPGESIEVGIHVDTSLNRFYVTIDGRDVSFVPSSETDGDRPIAVAQRDFAMPTPIEQAMVGLTLTTSEGPPLPVCNHLLSEIGTAAGIR